MKKIFEKKIIIGSVCGMIATVIGTIAIFFPSLFNLEQENLGEPVSMAIVTNADLDKLYKAIAVKDFKRAQIFQLDINFCRMQDIPYSVDQWQDDIITKDDNALSILVNAARPSLEYKHDYDAFPWQAINLEGKTTLKYLPPNSNTVCGKANESAGEDESYTLSGYFLPVEMYSPHAGEEVIVLRNVPIEQLKLKDY